LAGIGDTFSLLSVFYLFIGAYAVYQLTRNWRGFWDDDYTEQDRNLAGLTAFFLLVPVGVLLHELGHMAAAWTTGSQVLGLHYFVYWGYVELIPSSASPLLDWYIALSGNFVSYVLGAASLTVGLAFPNMKQVLRGLLTLFGALELLQTLIFYPAMSLVTGFEGDWDTIYSFESPVASGATLAIQLISLAIFFWLLRRDRVALASRAS
jgi:hypothetical protein